MFHGRRNYFPKNFLTETLAVKINYSPMHMELIPSHGLPYLQHTTLTRDKHPSPPSEVRTWKPKKRVITEPRLRPRYRWDW